MLASSAQQAFSREQVRRLLRISERQLRSWERQRLIAPADPYGFSDLVALRALVKLRGEKVPTVRIRRALDAVREKMRDVANPLTEFKLYAVGKRVHVEVEGRTMEPVSGQLLLNFDQGEILRLLTFPTEPTERELRNRRLNAEVWFERGLALEQVGAPIQDIVAAYQKALELDPHSAGALVNLGTLYFNVRDWEQAASHYLKALEVDPEYPLVHFNLGNLYDEHGDQDKALFHYQAALRLAPHYADAHYNIALLYQASNQPMKAVAHWKAYLKLDPSSHWAVIARRELAKLRERAIVSGSRRDVS